MQTTVRPTISAKEYCERRLIIKSINGAVSWLRSACGGFGFDSQYEQYGDVYRVVCTIQWKPLPLAPIITDIPKPEGSA